MPAPDRPTAIDRPPITRSVIARTKFPLNPFVQSLLDKYGGVAFPIDDALSNPYVRVISPAVPLGRNLVLNGDFATDTNWNKSAGCTISGGVGVLTAVTAGAGFSQTILQLGRVYQITFDLVVTSGTGRVVAGNAGLGTTRSTSGTYTDTIVCSGNTNFAFLAITTFTGTIDNVSVKELNIPSSTAVPVQLLNPAVWNGSGVGAWSGSATPSAVTTTRHDGNSGTVLRVTGTNNQLVSQSPMTVGQVYRVYGWCQVVANATSIRVVSNGVNLFIGTASTDWQPFDFNVVAASTTISFQVIGAGTLTANWDVTVVALDTGIRQDAQGVGIDLDMEFNNITRWSALNLATITKETSSPHSGVRNLRITAGSNTSPQSLFQTVTPLVIGKTYRIDGFYRTITTGTSVGQIRQSNGTQIGGNLTHSTTSAWLPFTVAMLATGTSINLGGQSMLASDWVEYDDITITEISPLVGLPGAGVTLGNTESSRLLKSASFNGSSTGLINLYSAQLNGIFNPGTLSFNVFFKVSSASQWTNGLAKIIARIAVNTSNEIRITKSGTNNQIDFIYAAGGTIKTISATGQSSTGWMLLTISVDTGADQFKVYINGSLISTATGLGVWSGNLATNAVLLGGIDTTGANAIAGSESQALLLPAAMTAAEVFELATLGDVA